MTIGRALTCTTAAGLGILGFALHGAVTAFTAPVANANAGSLRLEANGDPGGSNNDPHLPCADVVLWGNGLSGTRGWFSVDGWAPTGGGSGDQAFPGTRGAPGQALWQYSGHGLQQVAVIPVAALVAHASANGDAPVNGQGFHFKLEFSQDPTKQKTFWVNCRAATPSVPGGNGGSTGGGAGGSTGGAGGTSSGGDPGSTGGSTSSGGDPGSTGGGTSSGGDPGSTGGGTSSAGGGTSSTGGTSTGGDPGGSGDPGTTGTTGSDGTPPASDGGSSADGGTPDAWFVASLGPTSNGSASAPVPVTGSGDEVRYAVAAGLLVAGVALLAVAGRATPRRSALVVR